MSTPSLFCGNSTAHRICPFSKRWSAWRSVGNWRRRAPQQMGEAVQWVQGQLCSWSMNPTLRSFCYDWGWSLLQNLKDFAYFSCEFMSTYFLSGLLIIFPLICIDRHGGKGISLLASVLFKNKLLSLQLVFFKKIFPFHEKALISIKLINIFSNRFCIMLSKILKHA